MSTAPRLREKDIDLLLTLLSQARRPLTTAELAAAFRSALTERTGHISSATNTTEEE